MHLINMDCLDALKGIESNSIDSLVTDPPAGISFMNKEWDSHKGGRDEWIKWMTEIMQECLRVLKPGAHGFVWAIPRTSHWTATALENAGFEIRDVVTHLFGSGFPKSHNISKGIDKKFGVERKKILKPIAYPDSDCWGIPNNNSNGSQDGTSFNPNAQNVNKGKGMREHSIASSDQAKQWDGWGTALKPASEHWILIRKPLSEKSIVDNVLKWRTGGINIDESRINPTNDLIQHSIKYKNYGQSKGEKSFHGGIGGQFCDPTLGRFPANLVLSHSDQCTHHDEMERWGELKEVKSEWECVDDCPVKMLNEQSGILKSGELKKGHKQNQNNDKFQKSKSERYILKDYGGDSGGASRFFYCAKASKSERGKDNNHPTVKAKKLMNYLIKMITPPKGTVLDPFMGSGSTGVACHESGFDFIGIEREKEYFDIARARTNGIQPFLFTS